MHLVRVGRSPAYLVDMMTATADLPGRERLRCAKQFPIRNPRTEAQVWWASFLVRLTEGVELTFCQSLRTNEHWYSSFWFTSGVKGPFVRYTDR